MSGAGHLAGARARPRSLDRGGHPPPPRGAPDGDVALHRSRGGGIGREGRAASDRARGPEPGWPPGVRLPRHGRPGDGRGAGQHDASGHRLRGLLRLAAPAPGRDAHERRCDGARRGPHAAGHLCDAAYPAPVAAGNVETSQRLTDVVLGALARILPDELPAASAGTMSNLSFGGVRPGGAAFTHYETHGGGAGAGPRRAGAHALQTHMTNTRNTPVEALEAELPVRVLRQTIRRGKRRRGRGRAATA